MRERRGVIVLIFTLVIVVFFAGARITEAAEENSAAGDADRTSGTEEEPDEIAEAMKTEILSEFDFSELFISIRL